MSSTGSAERDGLTGVETAAGFEGRLADSLAAAGAEGGSVSVAMVDIDRFKRVNDDHGSAAGDELLKAVAKHLVEAAGEKGTVFRYGGDEFAVLLPGTEKEQTFLMMEAARSGFDGEHVFSAGGKDVKLPASLTVGIASYPEDGSRSQDILRKADDAVHRAKTTGRNRVCLARDERMVTKTSHYTQGQLERLSMLAKREGVGEAVILREALDDLFRKYDS